MDSPIVKPVVPNSRAWNTLCFFMKALLFLLGLFFIAVNIMAMQKIHQKFAKDNTLLSEIEDLLKSRKFNHDIKPSSAVALRTLGGGNAPITKVLPLLRLLEKVERNLHPLHLPPNEPRKIVIVGKTFILNRDFGIWDYTLSNAGFMPIKTTKQELQAHKYDDWVGLKCLDLFDGKSHCIEPNDLPTLKRYQKVSRLYGLRKTLWNKDRFCDTLTSALNDFVPKNESAFLEFVFPCWLLPSMFNDLIKKARSPKFKDVRFIAKPTDRGEGNGINVIDNIKDLAHWKDLYPENDEIVVQSYLPNPLLINQRKWDMRTYVLVTNIHPLRVYMFKDGLVRFASSIYDKNAAKGGKKTAFLTNTSVNKKAGIDVEDLTWPFPKVYAYMKKNGINAGLLWKRIERAVVQVLLSAEPAFAQGFAKLQEGFTCVNCYQLLGVDVIVDDTLTPRVIEINGEPSMQLSGEKGSQYDITKTGMTHDLAQLVYSRDSFARAAAKELTNLELSGFPVGYKDLGTCVPPSKDGKQDIPCLGTSELEYVIEMKREEQNMGGFRRIYPSKDGEYYTEYLNHLDAKMPYGAVGTAKVHNWITQLEKLSTWKSNNDILDPEYFKRTGQSFEAEEE